MSAQVSASMSAHMSAQVSTQLSAQVSAQAASKVDYSRPRQTKADQGQSILISAVLPVSPMPLFQSYLNGAETKLIQR